MREAEDLDALAAQQGRIQPVLLRVAPASLPRGFGINMAGKPTQFGVDEEDAPAAVAAIRKLSNLKLIGFHAYSGTQCVDAKAVGENFGIFARIFGEPRRAVRPSAPRRWCSAPASASPTMAG